MATQRYISTSFWTDKWVRELDPSERYLYIYLLTNPQTNIAGVYQITMDRIAFDTGYDERTLWPMFDRFARAGKAYIVDEEWIIIPSWPRHQKVKDRDNNRKGIDRVLTELPGRIFEKLEELTYQYEYLEEVKRPLGRGLQGASKGLTRESNYSDSDLDLDTDSSKEAPSADAGASTGEESLPAVVESGSEVEASPDTELYEWIKNRFESEQPHHRFTNYAKEGKAIHGIIAKSRERDPTNVFRFAEGMVETFAELRRRDRKFFGGQPFLPSSLNASGIWDRVLSQAYERWQQAERIKAGSFEDVPW